MFTRNVDIPSEPTVSYGTSYDHHQEPTFFGSQPGRPQT
jgi:hypothetical protein